MSYQKHEWQKSETITADKLNHIEDGVEEVTEDFHDYESATMGHFDNMSVGSARQLISDTGTPETSVYSFRATGGGNVENIGKLKEVQRITGGTVCWNQLNDNNGNPGTAGGVERAYNGDGTWTLSGTPESGASGTNIRQQVNGSNSFSIPVNHVVYISAGAELANDCYLLVAHSGTSVQAVTSGTGGLIKTNTKKSQFWLRWANTHDFGSGYTITPQLFDLTQMFGEAVADELLGLETDYPGAGVAMFRKIFPKEIYAYNAGTLMSVQVASMQNSEYNSEDETYSYISYPLDSSLELRGLLSLDTTTGNITYDGDTYTPDGTVIRQYAEAQLEYEWLNDQENENIGYDSTLEAVWIKDWNSQTMATHRSGGINAFCNRFTISTMDSEIDYEHNLIYFFNQTSVDDFKAQVHAIEQAESTVKICYELAAPTTETATVYSKYQLIDPNGTEAFIDAGVSQGTRDVAIPVQCEAKYLIDLQDKLEYLPQPDELYETLENKAEAESVASVQGSTASADIASGELLTQDGKLYKATQAIATGTAVTPGVNIEATNVAEEIKTDTTLSVPGKAADAKAVGDALAERDEVLMTVGGNNRVDDFEQGSLNSSGNKATSTTRIRSGFIDIGSKTVNVHPNGQNIAVCLYDSTKSFLLNTGWKYSDFRIKPIKTMKYCRFVVAKADDSTIIPSDLAAEITVTDGITNDISNNSVVSEGFANTPYTGTVEMAMHRGYNSIAPENTIPAFKLARQMGFSTIETDIQLTSDGIPVILHDATINRTSNGTGYVYDKTLAELKLLDFGSWKSSMWAGTEIPTFEEMLVYCKKIGLKVYIEVKKESPWTQELITNCVNIVRKTGMKKNVSWISFSSTVLGYVRTADESARLGYLMTTYTNAAVDTCVSLRTSKNEVMAVTRYDLLSSSVLEYMISNDVPLGAYLFDKNSDADAMQDYVTMALTNEFNAAEYIYRKNINL